jgi:hypothetical protein
MWENLLSDKKDSSEGKSSSSSSSEMKMDLNRVILIRADHLLNVTLTKTTLDLLERIQSMFDQAYEKGYSSTDDQQ